MKHEQKHTEQKNNTRRPYKTPEIVQVKLTTSVSVLQACQLGTGWSGMEDWGFEGCLGGIVYCRDGGSF